MKQDLKEGCVCVCGGEGVWVRFIHMACSFFFHAELTESHLINVILTLLDCIMFSTGATIECLQCKTPDTLVSICVADVGVHVGKCILY